jgi:hypothetical protein
MKSNVFILCFLLAMSAWQVALMATVALML